MKNIALMVLVGCLIVTPAYSASLYEVVSGGPQIMEALAEQKKNIYSFKLSESTDIDGKDGSTTSLDFEIVRTLPPFTIKGNKDYSFSQGISIGLKHNESATTWKAGLMGRLEGPAFKSLLSPYGKLGMNYQGPSSGKPAAYIGAASLGIAILLGSDGCKKSALEIEGTYQKANKDIYISHSVNKDYDSGISVGLKVFF